ncbi:MAG TPA: glycosyltransferase family 9 protein [Candidatus Eisenbacteria bacterium]|nr:glycosyltransferase family 9 protein [Candidatus Eisenbacteria bacterium]
MIPEGPGRREGEASEPPPVATPRRILVSRLRQIGDAILSLPTVDALRARFPDAVIDYLAEEGPAQAAVGHPAIHTVHVLPGRGGAILPAPWRVLRALRDANYDWVIDLYGNPRSAILAAWTGAPIRVGPTRRGRRHLYSHHIPAVREPLSAVAHHLLALHSLGIDAEATEPRLHLAEAEERAGQELLEELESKSGFGAGDRGAAGAAPRIGLHVGNRWSAKRWPEDRFAALLRVLSRSGHRAVVLAGPGEEAMARRIAAAAPASRTVVVAGLPLRRYWGVVAALDVLVTNDGSPLHAGPALGVPTVGILGPTVPEIWFPYSPRAGHQLLCKEIWCRPCHRHECARLDCLEWISVGEARRAIDRALAWRGASRASA